MDNPFHNSRHATDVAASMMFFIMKTKSMQSNINMSDLNAALIAAFCHDVKHPGLTNRHLILARDKLALRYND